MSSQTRAAFIAEFLAAGPEMRQLIRDHADAYDRLHPDEPPLVDELDGLSLLAAA